MVGELLQPVVEIVFYMTGKTVVRLLSLRRWDAELRSFARRRRGWFAFSYERDGKRYLDPDAVMLVGLVFWLAIGAAIVAIWLRSTSA